MFNSTSTEQKNQVTHWYIVFDSRNGNVIHTHQFMSEATDSSEIVDLDGQARLALQFATQHCDTPYLEVTHAPSDFRFEPGMTCRVDLASGKLITSTELNNSLREIIRRERIAQDGKTARGEPPPASALKSRMEMWHTGHVVETCKIADTDNLEASVLSKGQRAVRAYIRPGPKDKGGE